MGEDFPPVPGGFAAGSRIAGYLLEDRIGQGGMAEVFRAVDVRLSRRVALKILAPALADDEAFRQRFVRESRAAAAVDDPHIIPVYEAGEAEGVLFIAMRLVRGGDVRTLLQREGPLPPGRVAAIVSPVAAALDAAHDGGLVHRDVKPANMLLDVRPGRPDHVYLADFGLSKRALAGSGLTGTGQFLGTLAYIAPEQIEGRLVDGRADLYALAAATFELLSGTPPFLHQAPMALMYAHLSEPAPALTARRPGSPQAADGVFIRALAKNPSDRYASCREFSDAIRTAFGIGRYAAEPGTPVGRPATDVVSFPSDPAAGSLAQPSDPGWAAGTGPLQVGASRDRDLVGPATEASSLPLRPTRPQPEGYRPAGRPGRRRFRWAAAVIAVLALGLAGGVAASLLSGSGGSAPRSSQSSGPGTGLAARWAAGHTRRSLVQLGSGIKANLVEGMAFGPDGKTLAIATFGKTYLVDVATGSVINTFIDPASTGIQAVAFSPDGGTLATADHNGSTYLWDATSGATSAAPAATLPDPASGGVQALAFSPDGSTLASGDLNGSTYLWDLTHGATPTAPSATLPDPAGRGVQAVAFSPDGGTLATGDLNGSTYLWDLTAGGTPAAPAATWPDPASGGVQAVAFSPDGSTLATGDANGSTYLWRTSATQASAPAATLRDPGATGRFGTVAVAYSPDGQLLAAAGYSGQTYLWATATMTIIATLADPGSGAADLDVQAVKFRPHGDTLATGDTHGNAYLWTPS